MSGLDVVVFENMKPYCVINEDIVVVYAVDKKVRTSTRDWIGLFKKGWTKPEELIIFEWTSGHLSEETLPRRTVTFCSKDFCSRINPNDQYQFAYISKFHEVLGRSQFFFFITEVIHQSHHNYLSENVSSIESGDEDNDWLHLSQAHSLSTNRAKAGSGMIGALPHPDLPPASPKWSYKWSSHLTQNVNSTAKNTLKVSPVPSVVDTLAHPDLPPNYNHKKTASKKCPSCSCPSDYIIANNRLTEKVVSQAEQIRSLQSKLTALQSKLELCHVSQQQLKIKADMACREKENYCSFIGQFIESLKRRRQLKIVDSEGNMIMVKNVSPQVRNGQTTIRKQSVVTSVGTPPCPHVNFNAAGDVQQPLRQELATNFNAADDVQQRLRQEFAAELRQVCRKYCEETESVQVGSTEISVEDSASAATNPINVELGQDYPAQLICADASEAQLENGTELVNNQPTENEKSKELQELFHCSS